MTVYGDSFLSNVGRKGANQACAIQFLGGDVIETMHFATKASAIIVQRKGAIASLPKLNDLIF